MLVQSRIIRASFVCLLLLSSGCAIAPFSTLQTGRSSGAGDMTLDVGAAMNFVIPAAKFQYGITENLDLGVQYESFNVGALLKYAFVNNPSGWSFAAIGSYGSISNGEYYYFGPILSYKSNIFEPFLSVRLNGVRYDGSTYDNSSIRITFSGGRIQYLQYSAGTAIWFSEKVGLIAEYTTFGSIENATFSNGGYGSGAFIFKF